MAHYLGLPGFPGSKVFGICLFSSKQLEKDKAGSVYSLPANWPSLSMAVDRNQ